MHVILDPGHGGIINGQYVTPGKRSPKWTDGTPQLFEGVHNREIVAILKKLLTENNIPYTDVVDSQTDVSLSSRVQRANTCYSIHKDAIYISIHADAAGDGKSDYPATGISVYTSKGETKSDLLAEHVIDALQLNFENEVKWRFDQTDHDKDKEDNFYVISKTLCPAILVEGGFMTNLEECKKMHTIEWKTKIAKSILQGILKFKEL